MISNKDIEQLVNVSKETGFNLNEEDLKLIIWPAGQNTHVPKSLPKFKSADYIFKWRDEYLKVGKVNSNSNARFQSQHYNPDSSKSNLSKSILLDRELSKLVGNSNVGDWIKINTTRYNILIPDNLGRNFVHFVEAFFILKCSPRFENSRA